MREILFSKFSSWLAFFAIMMITPLSANPSTPTGLYADALEASTQSFKVFQPTFHGVEYTATLTVEDFPDPYCVVTGNSSVEPITRVIFADVDNPSSASSTVPHEDFTAVTANVEPGDTYTITVEGNTSGNWSNRVSVWIDWNQDGAFDEATERYDIEDALVNSTGQDGQQISTDITVPADALTGDTRMRVMKRFSSLPVDSCTSGSSFGQTEDYTVNVGGGGGGPFPDPYCEVSGNSSVEPITRVIFADVDNPSSASSTISHEDFTAVTAHVETGETYIITVEGNTSGNWTNRVSVWIDWNQDGEFNETTERYDIADALVNSTGEDGQQISTDITVPADALAGDTRMRVMKKFNSYPNDSCTSGSSFGQAEDYTVNVAKGAGGSGGSDCITTLFGSNNGGSAGWGQYFDVSVKGEALSINSLEINTSNSGDTVNVDVYIIEGGTYAGNELNAAAWGAPAATGSGTGMGDNNPTEITLDAAIELNANENYAFAIYFDASPRYTNGAADNRHFENDQLELDLGASVSGFFTGSLFPDRIFNGSLCYDYGDGGGTDPGEGESCEQDYYISGMNPGVYDNGLNITDTNPSFKGANDVVVEAGVNFKLESIMFDAISLGGNPTGFTIQIHEDNGSGGVGAAVGPAYTFDPGDYTSTISGDFSGFDAFRIEFDMSGEDINFDNTAGSSDAYWWISIQADQTTAASSLFWLVDFHDGNPSNLMWQFDGSVWAPNDSDYEGAMLVEGVCSGEGGGTDPGEGESCEQDYYISGMNPGVYDNGLNITDTNPSFKGANDVVVEAGVNFKLESIMFDAISLAGNPTGFTIQIHEDNGSGGVGAAVGPAYAFGPGDYTSTISGDFSGFDAFRIEFDMSGEDINFDNTAGSSDAYWWIAIQADQTTAASSLFWLVDFHDGNPSNLMWQFDGSVWAPNDSDYEGAMLVEGICSGEGGGGSNDYCIPEGVNPDRYINDFVTTGGLINITNLNTGFSPGGYGDFYDTHEVSQEQYQYVDFDAQFEGGTFGFRIWVDWNQDGSFDASEEVAWKSSSYATSHNGSFMVPADALPGETRMRIVNHWLSTSADIDPCETNFTYGEFEDYKFTVVEATEPPDGCLWSVHVWSDGTFGDEVNWTLTNSSGTAILSGGNYGFAYDDTQSVYAEGPLEFHIDTIGTFGDNEANYEVSNGTEIVASGFLNGGQEATHSDLACDGDEGPEPGDCWQGIPSVATVPNAYGITIGSNFRIAEDFTVPEGTLFNVNRFTFDINNTEVPDFAVINVREDNGGEPGAVLETIEMAPTSWEEVGTAFGEPIYNVVFDLSTPIEFGEGVYWIDPKMSVPSSSTVWWAATDEHTDGALPMFSGDDGASWELDPSQLSMVFTVEGHCETLGIGDLSSFDFSYYPNPVRDVLYINSAKNIENVRVFNLTGQEIISNSKVSNGQIDVNALPTGVYVFRVMLEGGQVETFKIIKR